MALISAHQVATSMYPIKLERERRGLGRSCHGGLGNIASVYTTDVIATRVWSCRDIPYYDDGRTENWSLEHIVADGKD